MGFLSKIFGGGRPAAGGQEAGDPDGFHFYVRCARCGELLHIRASKANDVVLEFGEDDSSTRVLHKEILGSQCQNLMYVHLTLDDRYNIVESETERCALVSREEYEAGRTTA